MRKMETLLNNEFPVNQEFAYLNHAAVAPWPESARRAVAHFAQQNTHAGAAHYPDWLVVESQLRANLAQMINAPTETVAFVKNTSEALSFVAYGIDWQQGDRVVIPDEEFPSNRIVWESLREKGVVVETVSLSGEDPEERLLRAIAQSPRLVSVSAVQYATGIRLDLKRIGEACKANGVLFCVDAIQIIGALQFDVQACHCDFAMADGHKWLLGPEGLGVFYIRPEVMDQLTLNEYGWHMIEHAGDYSRTDWTPASSARRFECGSPNLLAAHALKASTDLLIAEGMDRVEKAICEKTQYLADALQQAGARLITPEHSIGRSGILTFNTNGKDPKDVWQALMKERVICMHRGGGLRFSPHCHTPQSTLDAAVLAAARICQW